MRKTTKNFPFSLTFFCWNLTFLSNTRSVFITCCSQLYQLSNMQLILGWGQWKSFIPGKITGNHARIHWIQYYSIIYAWYCAKRHMHRWQKADSKFRVLRGKEVYSRNRNIFEVLFVWQKAQKKKNPRCHQKHSVREFGDTKRFCKVSRVAPGCLRLRLRLRQNQSTVPQLSSTTELQKG